MTERDCKHGRLARSCETCAMEEEIDDLKYELSVAREAQQCECSTDDACRFARERDALKADLEAEKLFSNQAMASVIEIAAQRDALRSELAEVSQENKWLVEVDEKQIKMIRALEAELAALTQQSFDLRPQCGWRTFIPSDGCLNCLTEDAKEKTE